MKYITDAEIDRISGETGKSLSKEEKVKICIQDTDGNNIPWEGGINGHFFRIPRGIDVFVPKSIAELIAENDRVTVLSENQTKAYKKGSGKKLSN